MLISDIVSLPINFDEKLAKGINAFHQFMADEPKWFLMILELIVHSTHQPENKATVITLYKQLMDLIRSGFTEARNADEIKRKFDDDAVSSLILSTCIGLGVLNVLDEQATDFPKAYHYLKEIVDNFIKIEMK